MSVRKGMVVGRVRRGDGTIGVNQEDPAGMTVHGTIARVANRVNRLKSCRSVFPFFRSKNAWLHWFGRFIIPAAPIR